MHRLEIEVVDVKGECSAGYRKGDKFYVEDPNIISSSPICIYAISALIPYLTAKYRDVSEDDWINHVELLECPDPENTVMFRVRRV